MSAYYRAAEGRQDRMGLGWILVGLGIQFFALAALVFCLVYVIPQFEQMFQEQGAELPAITQILLSLSHAVRSYWFAAIPLTAALVGAYGITLSRLGRAGFWVVTVGLITVEAACAVTLVVGLFLPMQELLQHMSA